MNIDDKQLIDLVRQFDVLFDKRNINFKNKQIRENSWNIIGEVLGTTGCSCEQRFNVLRAKYNVERKRILSTPSGSGSSKEWELYSLMTFLDAHIVTRRTKENVVSTPTSSPSTSAASSVWDVMESMTMTADDIEAVPQVNEQPSKDEAEAPENPVRHKRTKTTRPDLGATITKTWEKVHSYFENRQQQDTDDSDVAFGKYVGLELRGLQNNARKRNLKSQITV